MPFIHHETWSADNASEEAGPGHFNVVEDDGEFKVVDGDGGMTLSSWTELGKARIAAQDRAKDYDARFEARRVRSGP